jgi:GGDEF domain-containing protein
VGIFAMRSRSAPAMGPEASARVLEPVRMGLPPRFEAVAEMLASGPDSAFGSRSEACAVAGAQMAKDGASLDETLAALQATYQLVCGTDPSYDDVRSVARAWSDAILAYVHQMACEDPMTGLVTVAHVRTRLSELYRGELRGSDRVRQSYALVIAELPADRPATSGPEDTSRVLSRTMRLAELGDTARTVFSGTETIGRLGADRIVVVAARDERLGQRVALLRRMARTVDTTGVRVWIEGLPADDAVAALLLDELARS